MTVPRLLLCFALSTALTPCFLLAGRPQTKQQRKQDAKLRKELKSPYRRWLDDDVSYIISDEERRAFDHLGTDDERDQFIEQFWLRRDPTPDSAENEFKEEHYRRIAYANEHFASGVPGWKTDRGRIYIVFGPPDEIESHPSGGTYNRPADQGGGSTAAYPYEQWRYRYIEGIGNDVVVEFVDRTMTGEYRLALDPSEKDALLNVTHGQLAPSILSQTDSKRFDALVRYAEMLRPPPARYKDLEAAVTSDVRYYTLPMQVQANFLHLTDSTVLTPVTVQFDSGDLQFQRENGADRAALNLYVRVTSMTRRVIGVHEDAIAAELQSGTAGSRPVVYQTAFFLAPGRYHLNVAAKDVNGGGTGTFETALDVPTLAPGTMTASAIILAGSIERVPTRNVNAAPFVIGDWKVQPRIGASFNHSERMGIYLQAYGMSTDGKTGKPDGTVSYQVTKGEANQPLFDFTEEVSSIPGASARLVTVTKLLPLVRFDPGHYTLKVVITDRNRNSILTRTAQFSVR